MGKRNCLFAIALLYIWSLTAQCPVKTDFKPEKLHYDVVYNWGFIWKTAASATLSLKYVYYRGQDCYETKLEAQTLKFADKIYRVRDTLISIMTRKELTPLYYAKISDEDNVYRKDEVTYKYENGWCIGDTKLYRPKRNATDYAQPQAETCAYDMLSVFYYIRTLDLKNTPLHKTFSAVIFSGNHTENMRIENLGLKTLKTRDKKYEAYCLELHFLDNKGEKISGNIKAWISNDGRYIPLQVEGKLAIGSLKAIYMGK